MKKIILISILIGLWSVSFASNYGSMHIASASTNLISSALTAGDELQLTGYSAMENSGFTYSADKLTAGSGATGKYMFRFSLSFTASEGLWDIIVKNNTTAESQIIGKRKIGATNTDVGNVAITGLINIAATDYITIYVKSNTAATNFTPIHSQVTLIPIASASSPNIGEMTIASGSSSQALTTAWTDLTGFSEGQNLNGFTHSSSTLTAPSDGAGYYYVSLSVSFKTSSSSGSDYEFGIATNSGSPSTMLMKRNLSGAADRGNTVLCGIMQLSNSDVIHVKVKNSITNNIVVQYANLVVTSIDLSNSAYYGNMYMSGNTSHIAINDATWTQDPNFGAATNNSGWSVSSGKLVPSASAVGFYLLSFNCALTYKDVYESGTYIYPLAAIFVNGVEQTNITFERKLQKKDDEDYGSLSGSGFVRIGSTSDLIELKYKGDGSGDKNILTKDANLNLVQLSTVVNLPITLVSFNAMRKNDFIKLDWTTSSEEDNSYFEIQSSSKGKCFNDIGRIKGAGNSNSIINYSYNDTRQIDNIVYYRLKQVDYNGKFTFSKIICINSKTEKTQLLSQYIIEDKMHLNIQSPKSQNIRMQLYTLNGHLVKSMDMTMTNGSNEYKISLNNLPTGIYMLRLFSESININRKIIKI